MACGCGQRIGRDSADAEGMYSRREGGEFIARRYPRRLGRTIFFSKSRTDFRLVWE